MEEGYTSEEVAKIAKKYSAYEKAMEDIESGFNKIYPHTFRRKDKVKLISATIMNYHVVREECEVNIHPSIRNNLDLEKRIQEKIMVLEKKRNEFHKFK